MRKIDVMIVGAQKAGTTSLHNYLSQHPDVLGHPQLEFAYFESDTEFAEDYSRVFKRYFTNGRPDAPVVIAKNAAIYTSPKALARLHEHNPDCNIIFLLREPVARAISAYNMERFNGAINDSIDELVAGIQGTHSPNPIFDLILQRGLYAEHLQNILKFFPKSQVKLLLFEEFSQNPESIVKNLYSWIGLDDFKPDTSVKHNTTQQARSKAASNALKRLRTNNNPLKRFARAILPYRTFSKIGQFLLDKNKSSEKPKPVSDAVQQQLHAYYLKPNEELTRISDLNISQWEHPAVK